MAFKCALIVSKILRNTSAITESHKSKNNKNVAIHVFIEPATFNFGKINMPAIFASQGY